MRLMMGGILCYDWCSTSSGGGVWSLTNAAARYTSNENENKNDDEDVKIKSEKIVYMAMCASIIYFISVCTFWLPT